MAGRSCYYEFCVRALGKDGIGGDAESRDSTRLESITLQHRSVPKKGCLRDIPRESGSIYLSTFRPPRQFEFALFVDK